MKNIFLLPALLLISVTSLFAQKAPQSAEEVMKEAFIAADELEKEGISCEIIDLRTVRPMDHEAILKSVKKTNRLVVLEEAWPFGSVSSEITYIVQERAYKILIEKLKVVIVNIIICIQVFYKSYNLLVIAKT